MSIWSSKGIEVGGADVPMGIQLKLAEGWVFVAGMSKKQDGERVATVYRDREGAETFRITIYDAKTYKVRKR